MHRDHRNLNGFCPGRLRKSALEVGTDVTKPPVEQGNRRKPSQLTMNLNPNGKSRVRETSCVGRTTRVFPIRNSRIGCSSLRLLGFAFQMARLDVYSGLTK